MLGILSIPLFIIFWLSAEFSAFDLIVRPILAKLLASPLPVCSFVEALYLLILASLSRSDVEGVNLTFFFCYPCWSNKPRPHFAFVSISRSYFLSIFNMNVYWELFSANSLVSCSKSCIVGQCYYFGGSSSSQYYFFSHLFLLRLNFYCIYGLYRKFFQILV